MRTLRISGIVLLLISSAAMGSAAEQFTIGSQAPPLDIEHWLTQKDPVTEFQRGHVYIVEFWATWCGPCISSMPHLRDIQLRHAKDVTVISVSDEDKDTIETFLDRQTDGGTFREIASHYWLATDPDGSVKRDYMRAAGQSGIPTAFIVGRSGEIEWIGHPMQVDKPLAGILANDWDREAYARQMHEEQELRAAMRVAFVHARNRRFTEALAAIDAIRTDGFSPESRQRISIARQQIEQQSRAGEAVAAERSQINIRQLAIGDRVTIPVTGRQTGAIWGDAVYTLDSDLGTAAVHAGLVGEGETKTLRVWIVPAPSTFSEANRNGVQSRRWGSFSGAFILEAADAAVGGVTQQRSQRHRANIVTSLQIGESRTVSITGAARGPVWGTEQYTGDSLLEAAAVHAGAVQVGERVELIVTRVQPPARFEGSEQHGIRSSSWGPYPMAFTVQRAPNNAP
jgi:thiol-disulfide isomerase/thioredoxin